jgi:hypothetical protein
MNIIIGNSISDKFTQSITHLALAIPMAMAVVFFP